MRVIGGTRRGTKLQSLEGETTRPTTDRIKETLFNMINFDLPECTFLDLFSGSGSIGIEALSRGAKEAIFVEKDKEAFQIIRKNIEKTRLQENSIVHNREVEKVFKMLSKKEFDVIFMDPPYHYENIEDILYKIVENNILAKDGKIIIENSSDALPVKCNKLKIVREKVFRTTTLTFWEKI
ncbi:16S rRNA (guanine(966)-N(2))-methyltransferase RsmD [Candidatus Epulonipiscium fishelsonii]|uniref:16S rRNA (Guanine(966)-N(2))-methyltransferase RsmD n=1 Tax=Candidatus Epulonipiscium fishelsonii TaxID=77094 RepID=A0ACC8XFT8_9FIRM|nr:16S rRNA (guanine(966)-N(2))-methyltransferase RsmD [Epulopiscium sp. SCG-B11WGA-EpuloA1]ONI42880.1 16S rRNA (guanine(966)-N(2))-methyltransferase RsmD [Epulopiscium sp. SCG-B05WGA-EpuloA1]